MWSASKHVVCGYESLCPPISYDLFVVSSVPIAGAGRGWGYGTRHIDQWVYGSIPSSDHSRSLRQASHPT